VAKTTQQRVVALGVTLILLSGCATGRQFRSGQQAARAGEWDAAVTFYRAALARDPSRVDIKIALQRATVAASAEHMTRARELEAQEQWSAAAAEYRLAADLDPANVFAAAKAVAIERRLRAEIEALRPPSRMDTLREQARQSSPMPTLIDPQVPINLRFVNTSVREILTSIGTWAGINVSFVEQPTIGPQLGRAYSIDLQGESLESALNQVLNANQLTFKVINPRGILVYGSDQGGRQAHDDVFVQVFYLSHVEATEMSQLLQTLTQQTQGGARPQITQNKNTNALTVRATMPVLQVFEQIIRANDKPKAEVLIDVEILEVDSTRVKEMGLNLSQYALGFAFSPEVPPGTGFSPPPFNLNTVSQGVSTADFYATVPTALIRMLEEDQHTRLLARPQLRGQERSPLSLNLGEDIPVPQTTFAAQVAGGLATTPTTSFQYRTVGVVLTINPQVSFDGEIILDVSVESSRRGQDVTINDQTLPSFGTRKAQTKLRMRDGESNLLAGLISQEDRQTVTGLPGLNRIPFLRSLFGGTVSRNVSSDIVMIITPRILRSQELTAADMAPMYVGTGNNFGASSTPPLISPQPVSGGTTAAPPVGVPPAGAGAPPAGAGAPTTPPAVQAVAPPAATTAPPPSSRAVGIVPVTGAEAPPATPPVATGPTRVAVTPPPGALQVGGQPYNVPITVANAAALSSITVTITYNPAVLRATIVNEGSVMRADGATTSFVPKIDASTGRIDMVVTRPADKIGASGNGILASVVFEAIGAGTSQISLSGIGLSAAGTPVTLQFVPASVTVR
jgi:general secretion pathway protein D